MVINVLELFNKFKNRCNSIIKIYKKKLEHGFLFIYLFKNQSLKFFKIKFFNEMHT